jgi:hypothetical protein
MSLEAIVDAAALKAGTVTGIKRAYGTGNTAGGNVLPRDIADGPVAIVLWDTTDVIIPTTFEELEHHLLIHVYVPGVDQAYAYKTLVPFVSRFVTVWRLDRSLGGACVESFVDGADGIGAVTVNDKPFSRLSIRVTVRDVALGTTTSV